MSSELVDLCGASLAAAKHGAVSTPHGCVVSDGDDRTIRIGGNRC